MKHTSSIENQPTTVRSASGNLFNAVNLAAPGRVTPDDVMWIIIAVLWMCALNPFGWEGFPNDTIISADC